MGGKATTVMTLAAAVVAAALLTATPAGAADPALDPDALPDLRVANGDNDIRRAWLIAPTDRYVHFVQGSRYEAGGVRVETSAGETVTLMLDEGHVFEDRQPRLADIDADGRDELILVLTSVGRGASLAIFGLQDNRLVMKAKTDFIGRPQRWLNPAGIADFDGDGRLEIALVAMPHLARRLELYRLERGGLRLVGSVADVSNHRNGSAHTGLAAVADIDGDGVADLVVPDGARQVIRVIAFGGAHTFGTELARHGLPAPVDGPFSLVATEDGWRLSVGLEDGRQVQIGL